MCVVERNLHRFRCSQWWMYLAIDDQVLGSSRFLLVLVGGVSSSAVVTPHFLAAAAAVVADLR